MDKLELKLYYKRGGKICRRKKTYNNIQDLKNNYKIGDILAVFLNSELIKIVYNIFDYVNINICFKNDIYINGLKKESFIKNQIFLKERLKKI